MYATKYNNYFEMLIQVYKIYIDIYIFFLDFFFYIQNMRTNYYHKNKERLPKKAPESYQNLSEELEDNKY